MQGINGQAAMTSCFKGLYFLINYNFLATASDTSVSYQAIKQKFFSTILNPRFLMTSWNIFNEGRSLICLPSQNLT